MCSILPILSDSSLFVGVGCLDVSKGLSKKVR